MKPLVSLSKGKGGLTLFCPLLSGGGDSKGVKIKNSSLKADKNKEKD